MNVQFIRSNEFRKIEFQDLHDLHDVFVPIKGGLLFVVGNMTTLYFYRNGFKKITDNLIVIDEDGLLNANNFDDLIKNRTPIRKVLTIFKNESCYLDLLNSVPKSIFFAVLNTIKEYSYIVHTAPEKNILNGFEKNEFLKEELSQKQFKYFIETGYRRFIKKFFDLGFGEEIGEIKTPVKLKGASTLIFTSNLDKKSILKSNIIALIGKNGVGKTQTLKAIKSFCLNTQIFKKVIDINLVSARNTSTSNDRVSLSTNKSKNINLTSSLCYAKERSRKIDYFNSEQILKKLLTTEFLCDDIMLENSQGDLVSFWEGHPSNNINFRIKPIFIRDGRQFLLSQGQKYLLSLTLLLLLHIDQYSCILIDEPEIYLHPNLIISLQHILQSILKQTSSKAFLSTHSIFLIRELSKDYVYIFEKQNEIHSYRQPVKETLGGSLDQLADEIFYSEDMENSFDELVNSLRNRKVKLDLGEILDLPTGIASRVLADD